MFENTLIRLMVLGGGIYLLLNLYALVISDKLIFQPQAPSYTQLPNEIKIKVGNGEALTAVYFENPTAEYTILFSHGNAEDLGTALPFIRQFYDLGYSLLLYDYRGYGTSAGTPSTANAKQDVAAVYTWLIEEKGLSPETILAHGRSLGGSMAIWLAANYPVGGLIAECSFLSAFRVKTHKKLLPWDKFDNLRSIKKVTCPVLIIHGVNDSIIPVWHGKKLYEAAPGIKKALWIEGGRHHDYAYVAGENYFERIQQFIRELKDNASAY